jgi:type 1 glutamine amidotransferase
MSELSRERSENVSEAVARGTGLAGCHGGMCDAFRGNPLWQFMCGGNWVAHPGGDGVRYKVRVTDLDHPLTSGFEDFFVETEQYYLHVDPANHVLAVTDFPTIPWYHAPNGPVAMPVAWTRAWGLGRVYYNALGHKAAVIADGPPREMLRRGLLWAAEGKAAAAGQPLEHLRTPGSHW